MFCLPVVIVLSEVLAHPAEMTHHQSTTGLNGQSITLIFTATNKLGIAVHLTYMSLEESGENDKRGNQHPGVSVQFV